LLKNRRGFLCRIRNKESKRECCYSTVHVTGFIQSHRVADLSSAQHNYFLATIRLFELSNKSIVEDGQEIIKFSTRHDRNGRITFIELEYVNIKYKY
jgi:hypothetical protein